MFSSHLAFDMLKVETSYCILKQASLFSFDKEMKKVDPFLQIKVYDYDIFSSDDMLG